MFRWGKSLIKNSLTAQEAIYSHLIYKFTAWVRNPLPWMPAKSEVIGTKDIDITLGDWEIVESHCLWL